MNRAGSCQAIFEPGVAEFLKRRAAEVEFQIICELVDACFPDLRDIQVFLQEDPDEDDRWRVVIHVRLPLSHPLDLLQEQERRFYEQLVERCPPAQYPDPVCGLMIGFTEE